MHLEHKAGEEMFVDFAGKKLSYTDRETGKKHYPETFIAILPASHIIYSEVVKNQKSDNRISILMRY